MRICYPKLRNLTHSPRLNVLTPFNESYLYISIWYNQKPAFPALKMGKLLQTRDFIKPPHQCNSPHFHICQPGLQGYTLIFLFLVLSYNIHSGYS